jgi:hypothetical protein
VEQMVRLVPVALLRRSDPDPRTVPRQLGTRSSANSTLGRQEARVAAGRIRSSSNVRTGLGRSAPCSMNSSGSRTFAASSGLWLSACCCGVALGRPGGRIEVLPTGDMNPRLRTGTRSGAANFSREGLSIVSRTELNTDGVVP